MNRKKERQLVYDLKSWGAADGTDLDADKRCAAVLLVVDLKIYECEEAKIVKSWPKDASIQFETVRGIEDMPWIGHSCHAVSDKLKDLIERHAPNHAQFLPLQTVCCGKRRDSERFWIANWLIACPCLDRENAWIEGDDIVKEAVRLDRIPNDVMVCRMSECLDTTIIRDELRREFDLAGVTGCQYYPIKQR